MHHDEDGPARSDDRRALAAVSLTGIVYFALAWLPQVEGPPVETASADEIRGFIADRAGGLELHATTDALAIPLVLVLTVSLARLVRARTPGSPLADLVAGGGVLLAVWHWVVMASSSSMLIQVLDGTSLATVDDATVRSWYAMVHFAELFADVGVVVMATVMGAASLAALGNGLLPRWLSWAGIAFAVGGLVGVVGVTMAVQAVSNAWFIGAFGWFLWVLAVAVTCGLRARRTASGRAAASVPA